MTPSIQRYLIDPREHEGTERDTEGVSCDMSYTLFQTPGASMESRHCGQDKRIFFCPVHSASTPCSLQAFGIRCIVTEVIFSFRKFVFRDVRTDYNFDLRFLAKIKKQISMIMADLS